MKRINDPAPMASMRRLDEEEVLGSLLCAPEHLESIRHSLRPSHFEDPHLGTLYDLMLRTTDITLQTVTDGLAKHVIPPPLGLLWKDLLSDMMDSGASPTSASVTARAQMLTRRYIDRRRRDALIRAGAAGANGDDLAAAVVATRRDLDDIEAEAGRQGGEKPLWIVTGDDLLSMSIPRREYVLKPYLREKDLLMVVGQRGHGKSWVGGGIAGAISCGGKFLEWEAPRPRRVLLVDGELPFETIQDRLRIGGKASGWGSLANLSILARDMQEPGLMPNLATPEGQAKLERYVENLKIDAVVLDNVSTLFVGGIENEAESWDLAQQFLLRLRQRGLMVAYMHHAGRSGNPRGTSKREDVLDTILDIRQPKDYSPTQGARFEVHYTKARGCYGVDVSPFEAWLHDDTLSGTWRWSVRSVEDATRERVLDLHREGMTVTEIAKEIGRDKSRVSRHLTHARKEGRIK
jgi:putative DNA primase/helicase